MFPGWIGHVHIFKWLLWSNRELLRMKFHGARRPRRGLGGGTTSGALTESTDATRSGEDAKN
jgi:hypothetical protein